MIVTCTKNDFKHHAGYNHILMNYMNTTYTLTHAHIVRVTGVALTGKRHEAGDVLSLDQVEITQGCAHVNMYKH